MMLYKDMAVNPEVSDWKDARPVELHPEPVCENVHLAKTGGHISDILPHCERGVSQNAA